MRWPRATDKKRSTSPSSTAVAVSTFGSYRDCLARLRLDEALDLGLVVVGSHAGADGRVQSARGQPVARLARRFVLLEQGDDPALLNAEIVHAVAGLFCEPSPRHARLHLQQRDDGVLPGPTL